MPHSDLLIQTLMVLFLLVPFIACVSTFEPPECQQWTGRPTYSQCFLALDSFVNTVTNLRGYSLDERIEFRSPRTVPKHPELPSELLIPPTHTFVSSDIGGPVDDRLCVVVFGITFPRANPNRRGDASFVSTYGELRQSAVSVIETCLNGILPYGLSGGTADISSTSPGEEGIKIGPTVLLSTDTDKYLMRDVTLSKLYKGEKLLGGNPWVEGGPNPYGPAAGSGGASDGKPDREEVVQQGDTETKPMEGNYCNTKIDVSCWPGFKCDAVSLVNGVKSVLWGLEMERAADFIGSCIVEGSMS
ncbi:MAG: hypothetical protein M1812_002201 [Candelaria pacifica]|nr:MAG: hypothetical protein M1812_002201 [Candelaria pacifica]